MASLMIKTFIANCNLISNVHNAKFLNKIYNERVLRYMSIMRTSEKHPEVQRNPNFSKVTQEDVAFFESLLGKSRVITDKDELEPFNTDWMKMYRGQSTIAIKPKSTSEVSEILKHCNNRHLAVCPQGGKTGLVGGSVPIFDEVIINMSLMNQIYGMDEFSGVLECESGCVLESLENYVNERGFIVPLDLGAKGSCQIGGNVSTNAGGLRYLRYGSMHGNVLGLEIVLADGQVLDCMNTMKKDNTGYDLKQLFIGAEGTLGVITKVSVQCPPKPSSQILAFLGTSSFKEVLRTFKTAKEMLSEILSSFELMDHESVEPAEKIFKLKPPISKQPFYMLIEVSGSNKAHDEEKLTSFLERVMSDGCVIDGTLATGPSHMKAFWSLREHVPISHFAMGENYKYDISLPLSEYYNLVLEVRHRLEGKSALCVAYGHLGDNNLHLTVIAPKPDKEVKDIIEPFVFEYAARFKGSVSAEHGIGLMNINALKYSKVPNTINLMKKFKSVLDPNGIINPYKVLL